ncbi:MAG: HAD family hydrolase [Magnetococcales bacterium]|nr:HAD family hydrolase [Magnetococcales bacterium]
MTSWRLEHLPWLPKAPDDFAQRCEVATGLSGIQRITALRELSGFSLDLNQLTRLSKRWRKVRAETVDHGLPGFRLGVISNATTGLLIPCLEASALRHGINLELFAADFGQTIQAALDPESPLRRMQLDGVLLAVDHRGLAFRERFEPQEGPSDPVAESLAQLDTMSRAFLEQGCKAIILQTLAQPPETLFGSLEPRLPHTLRSHIDRFNGTLATRAHASSELLLDVAGLAAAVGVSHWHDPGAWNQARLAFSQPCVPLYAEHVARLIAALLGKSRKCLVLDLDNTLWGGVIGDDGPEKIILAEGDPLGEAYRTVQRMALDLRNRGIILAVCSKNEEQTAWLPFRNHPDMCLRPSDIALFVANWQDKATNLPIIAERLNIGIDSLVFLDDNPVERARIRQALPEVAVPELPEDPALYARTTLAGGYFETIHVTADDRMRADQYRDNRARDREREHHHDLDSFLDSLEMRMHLSPFDATGRSRIAQLINKTNQFNLTTRRYTESQVEAMEQDAAKFTLQARLTDRFGDNGMISVVIVDKNPDAWHIDSWLMSCRVINRRVEQAIFAALVRAARQAGVSTLTGEYMATDRNGLVRDHYKNLGFVSVSETATASRWRFRVADFVPVPLPMTLID